MTTVENLRCEYQTNPLAIDVARPRLSWVLSSPVRGAAQTAYQVLVASSAERLVPGKADLWDTGKVNSAQSVNVEYAGAALRSNMDCYWCVQVWDETDQPTGFGPVACFGTALFDEADWQAQWIGMGRSDEPVSDPDLLPKLLRTTGQLPQELAAFEPDLRAPLLRKNFQLAQPVKRARAFVCGLGLYELRLNGAKVGDAVLATPRTEFRKRLLYSTYDITGLLQSGANAVGLILGNGWFNGQKKYWRWAMPWFGSPRAIVQLEIELADGSRQRVSSDESWRGDWSPITLNCIYDGEDYDARLEQPGWDTPGFDARHWQPVNQVAAPGGNLVALDHEANRVMKAFAPVAVNEVKPGIFVYDMGTVMTGWVRLRIPQGRDGATVTLRYAELLNADGALNCGTAGGARQAERYTMKGAANEVYEPRFTYHGFRYVEVTGFPGKPELETLKACFVHNGVEQAGIFECGHELINKIHRCTVQSQRCNLQMGVPTDDTQREERLGWCGDAWSYAQESFYNLDVARFWTKWITDFHDQQDEELGLVGYICPLPGFGEDLVWSAAFVLIPWWHYVHYGDRRILEASYPYLKKYIAYLEQVGEKEIPALPPAQVSQVLLPQCAREHRFPATARHGYLQRSYFGDHLATHEGSSGFCKDHPRSMATAFYYHDVTTMARIAETLGQGEDAGRYRALAEKIKEVYNAYFFEPNLGYYDIGCQSAQAFALAFDLVPAEHRDRVSGYLNSSVNFRQRRITAGYAGTKWVVNAIAHAGRNDVVWNRAIATDYPSWGYMLRGDKTTITENWAGEASQCHTTLGAAIDEWFYWGLAGIRPDETGPGYAKIIFQPYLPKDLPWAMASLRTVRGEIVSHWEHDGAKAIWRITVPANSTGTVHLPVAQPERITESGGPLAGTAGIRAVRNESGQTVVEVGSGSYSFGFPLAAELPVYGGKNM